MASIESEIRALLDGRGEAVGEKDIDRLLSFYSPDIVYFDIVPGLQYVGSEALRSRFLDWFGNFEGPIRQEIRDQDLHIQASGDIAVAYMLIRAGGVLKDGPEVDYWVRVTSGFQRADQQWLITHEHVSVPVEIQSRSAAMDLEP
jgi:ketosteroid isomerase-like protein